jgi:hypothetical protein
MEGRRVPDNRFMPMPEDYDEHSMLPEDYITLGDKKLFQLAKNLDPKEPESPAIHRMSLRAAEEAGRIVADWSQIALRAGLSGQEVLIFHAVWRDGVSVRSLAAALAISEQEANSLYRSVRGKLRRSELVIDQHLDRTADAPLVRKLHRLPRASSLQLLYRDRLASGRKGPYSFTVLGPEFLEIMASARPPIVISESSISISKTVQTPAPRFRGPVEAPISKTVQAPAPRFRGPVEAPISKTVQTPVQRISRKVIEMNVKNNDIEFRCAAADKKYCELRDVVSEAERVVRALEDRMLKKEFGRGGPDRLHKEISDARENLEIARAAANEQSMIFRDLRDEMNWYRKSAAVTEVISEFEVIAKGFDELNAMAARVMNKLAMANVQAEASEVLPGRSVDEARALVSQMGAGLRVRMVQGTAATAVA